MTIPRRSARVLAPLLLLAACGTDTTATAGATTSGTTDTTDTPGTTQTPTPTTGLEPTTTTTGATTGGLSDSATGSTTAAASTTQDCSCEPGASNGCADDQLLVCGADCQGFVAEPCPEGQVCTIDTCAPLACTPNETVCEGGDSVKTCDARGGGYGPPTACPQGSVCTDGVCLDDCALAELTPSSVGCSFFAMRMDNYNNSAPDSLIVGNTSIGTVATVQLYFTPDGTNSEQAQGQPVALQPGGTLELPLSNAPLAKVTALRKGGVYRVQSDFPVVAYQHSPIGAQATNDASMLLPEHALRQQHVVAAYRGAQVGEDRPGYFDVIATADNTTVTWTPPVPTLAGGNVPAVAAGQTGMVVLNRFDTLQVRVPDNADISGTQVGADKPIAVFGAVNCAFIPEDAGYCDHLEEQMLPLDYWGLRYVGAHSPKRSLESHYWRIYGGEDGTVVTATPALPGTPIEVDRGEWKEIVVANNTSTIFTGNKPFLAVQYLAGQEAGAGSGDPAMVQMIPTEQFLDRYAFVTGTGYTKHFAQVLRNKGNPDVFIDGKPVTGYYTIGNYEVADFKIGEGAHLAESAAPFGVINIGYTDVTSYAYPGGLRLAPINPQ